MATHINGSWVRSTVDRDGGGQSQRSVFSVSMTSASAARRYPLPAFTKAAGGRFRCQNPVGRALTVEEENFPSKIRKERLGDQLRGATLAKLCVAPSRERPREGIPSKPKSAKCRLPHEVILARPFAACLARGSSRNLEALTC